MKKGPKSDDSRPFDDVSMSESGIPKRTKQPSKSAQRKVEGVSSVERVGSEQTDRWQQTPYTQKQPTDERKAPPPRKGTSYSIEFEIADRHGARTRQNDADTNRVGVLPPTVGGSVEKGVAFTPTPILSTSPPVGHHGDLSGVMPRRMRAGLARPLPTAPGDPAGFKDEEIVLVDRNTAFGSVYEALGLDSSASLADVENKKQAKNALKVADRLISVPLSKAWHIFSEVVINLMFLLNVVVAAVDIALAPVLLYYKVTAFALGLIENAFGVIMWAIGRHPKFRNSEEKKRLQKYQQYTENVLGEMMIYPLLVLSVLGFTSDKMYEGGGFFLYVQVALILADVLTMLYNGILRMHMLRKLIKDLKAVLITGSDQSKGTWTVAGSILPRCYWTIMCNIILTLALTIMFGLQTNHDNYLTTDYRLTASSATIMLVIITLPTISLALFFVGNIFWVMEILTKINLSVGSNLELQEKLREEYGDSLADAMHYSRSKIPAIERRLAVAQKTSLGKKLLCCLSEIRFIVPIFLFQWLLLTAVFLFDAFEDDADNLTARLAFVALFVVANPHLSLLMVLNNFMVIVLLLTTILYPVILPLCCRSKIQSKYSSEPDPGHDRK